MLWPVCRLWLACSRSFISPPSGSVRLHRTATILPPAGTLLLITGWHPTATHRLAPYCYSPAGTLLLLHRSFDLSSVTPSRGIALPPWLLSNALDQSNNLRDRTSDYSGPTVSVFSPVDDHLSTPPDPRLGSSNRRFLLFWGACLRVWVSLLVRFYVLFPYVSGVYYLRW